MPPVSVVEHLGLEATEEAFARSVIRRASLLRLLLVGA